MRDCDKTFAGLTMAACEACETCAVLAAILGNTGAVLETIEIDRGSCEGEDIIDTDLGNTRPSCTCIGGE